VTGANGGEEATSEELLRLNYVFFVVICHALIVALCLHMTEIILEHQLLTRVHICLFSVFIDTCCVVVIGLYQAIV
jgi:hypothetical protein